MAAARGGGGAISRAETAAERLAASAGAAAGVRGPGAALAGVDEAPAAAGTGR
jgi:hypothetical protein